MKTGSTLFPYHLLLFFFVSALLVCGVSELSGSSEARELEVMREVLEGENALLPSRMGMVPSKPVLMHWIGAGLARALRLEVSPFLGRSVSYLSATFILLLTALLAFRIDGGKNPTLPLTAAGILMTTYEFQRIAGSARVDMLFSLFVVAAVSSILIPLYGDREKLCAERSAHFTGFFVWSALAVLTKGPLGLALPGIIAWGLLAGEKGLRVATFEIIRPRWQWILFLSIALPWYWYSFLKSPDAFSSRVLFENITRFLGGEHIVSKPFWYYLVSFLSRSFPWSVCFMLLCVKMFRARTVSMATFPLEKYKPFLIWFFIGFVLFSTAEGKRHSYLIPLYPAVSVVVAMYLTDFYTELSDASRRYILWIVRFVPYMTLCFFSILLAFTGYLSWYYYYASSRGLVWHVASWSREHQFMLTAVMSGFLLYCALRVIRDKISLQTLWICAGFLLMMSIHLGLALKAEMKGYRDWAEIIRKELKLRSDERFVLVKDPEDELFDPVMFYVHQKPFLMRPRESLHDLTCQDVFLTRIEFLQTWHVPLQVFVSKTDELKGKQGRAMVLGHLKDC